MKLKSVRLTAYLTFFSILPALMFFISSVLANQTYKFERMFPTMQQPWYFNFPRSIEVDINGYVYIADTLNHRVQKFTSQGIFVTKWGQEGNTQGEFNQPYDIAVDQSGEYVYVVDFSNYRIQKFTKHGVFVDTWGKQGTQNGEFVNMTGIAVDSSEYVYVADGYSSDTEGNRIQKFTSDGKFIKAWGGYGSEDGKLNDPQGIAIDKNDFIYVVDKMNNRVQKFTADGQFIQKWGQSGKESGEFDLPIGIAVDAKEFIYVADRGNNRIQRFTHDGDFQVWGSKAGVDGGEFLFPTDVAADGDGYVYVTDFSNRIQKMTFNGRFVAKWGGVGGNDDEFHHLNYLAVDKRPDSAFIYLSSGGLDFADRIQKFTQDGIFNLKWGAFGGWDGAFTSPRGVAIDNNGFVYVADSIFNKRIQKFTSQGVFVKIWGENAEFNSPEGLAFDLNGNLYVSDKKDHSIQKFTPDENLECKWGSDGSDDGQFNGPNGLAVDGDGYVYVADTGNHRIQKFTSDGIYQTQWGGYGQMDGQFDRPRDIAVDSKGLIYVADENNNRIQVFSPAGVFITKFGEHGFHVGQLNGPGSIAIDNDDRIYVADILNNRIQVFRKGLATDEKMKAVIVAGGGDYNGNNLWNATQICTNYAYRTLTYQGFTKESICYLTSDTNLDLDDNGEPDEVKGVPSIQNLEEAFTWAQDADSLVVYLVDHGGDGTFRLSESGILKANELDAWLDNLQTVNACDVAVVYDACDSGSFLSVLAPPTEKQRIVITSASEDEEAYFISQGANSFSNYFWTHIFNGVNIKNTFDLASQAVGFYSESQHPLLDDNGDGKYDKSEDGVIAQETFIGSGTVTQGDIPLVESVSPVQTITDTNLAALFAEGVTDNDGIARVWAVIWPPNYNNDVSDKSVKEMPYAELLPVGDNRYEGVFDRFDSEGSYQIAIYATDRIGNTSLPQLTQVIVTNPLRKKAIVVAGGEQIDPLWPAIENNIRFAYEALSFQGYSRNDIYLLSEATIPYVQDWDGKPNLANLEYAITNWAASSTHDLVIYLIGKGGNEEFYMNSTETLEADSLDQWIDHLQSHSDIPGSVTLVYDAGFSGSFIASLTPPPDKERILISSTNEQKPVHFLLNGDISFSRFFWNGVLNGANIADAFIWARYAIRYLGFFGYSDSKQTPAIDDNGNGIYNEGNDGVLARNTYIGIGIILADDEPIIGEISPNQELSGVSSATIWAQNVTGTASIEKVWAIIIPPGDNSNVDPVTDLPTFELKPVGNGRYEAICEPFSDYGSYQVVIYARDVKGNLSFPQATDLFRSDGPDIYEENDHYNQADVITINNTTGMRHNFHDAEDMDWVKFYGLSAITYTIAASNLDTDCEIVIELYDTDGTTVLGNAQGHPNSDGIITWTCPQDGVYYVKARHADMSSYGVNRGYDLKISAGTAANSGTIWGVAKNYYSGTPINAVRIKTNGNQSALSEQNGVYAIKGLPPGDFVLIAEAEGYETYTIQLPMLNETEMLAHDIRLVPSINLGDVITILKIVTGSSAQHDYIRYDINKDGKVGLPEAVLGLQKLAELR